jgi:hypothetical protein
MIPNRSLAFAPSDDRLSTKTTTREEWSYILLVIKELLLMSYDSFFTMLWKKLWKKGLK